MGHQVCRNEWPVVPGTVFSADTETRISQGTSLIRMLLSSAAEQNKADGNDEDGANAVFMWFKIDVLVDQQMFHLPGPLQETEFELVQHGKSDPREL